MRRRAPLAALLAAETASLTGTRLSMIAIPWLVLGMTGDALTTGLTAFAELLPYVLAKGLGGPLIDRLGPRTVALAGDLGSVVAVGAIPLLGALDLLGLGTLLPLVFLMGAMRGPADAAKQALVPAVAAAADVPLERTTGLLATVDRLATTLGAGLAGGLVAAIGPVPALVVDAAAFALSAAVVAAGLPRDVRKRARDRSGYVEDFAGGWRVLTQDPVLVGIVVMVALTNLLDQALVSVLLPVWAQETGGGAAALGGLIAVQSGFAVAGALAATAFAGRMPRLLVYVGAFLLAGAPRFLVLLPGVPTGLLVAVVAVCGLAIGVINPILSAVMFERVPAAFVGRVTALVGALAWTLMPFGGLLGGWAVERFGLSATLVSAGLAYLLVTMAPPLVPSFRAFSRAPALPETDRT